MDVVLGRGNTLWRFADCTMPDAQGWQTCAVDPAVVAARVSGLSYGFCMYDDLGTTWSIVSGKFAEDILPNRFFYSRESLIGKPFLEIRVGDRDTVAPQSVENVDVVTNGLPAGEAVVSWKTPSDYGGGRTLGFHVEYERGDGTRAAFPRYLVPMASQTGETVRMRIRDLSFEGGETITLSITAVDSVGNRSAPFIKNITLASDPSRAELEESDITPFSSSTDLPVVHGLKVSVVDVLDKIDPVTGKMIPVQQHGYKGGNHLYSAEKRLVRLQSARNEFVAFQLNLNGDSPRVRVSMAKYIDPHKANNFDPFRG
ncbi:hypothetical protein GF1_00610 [Desulfolithobacter dissulfuricans]|uniref:Fibronectin type-III domain-containing protein n=2 Tax=Desulfolithobacter dissulfuricans TaxID=2795293 RepID=A0A915U8U1_9BACT|nr:hypothetical protein GF1_00610 [Desulfolithobacter dissulfuricans]